MKKVIAVKRNSALFFILLALNLSLLFIIPFLLKNSVWWSLLALPALVCSNTYWALMHEGIHYSLFPNKKVNDYLSRAMGIVFGCAFNVVRAGHLLHHRMNRTHHDRTEVFEPEKQKWLNKCLYYYWFITGGLYQIEVLICFLSFVPKALLLNKLKNAAHAKSDPESIDYFHKQLERPNILNQIRIDTVLTIALYSISFILYGKLWWVLIVFLLVRGFLISMADNLPHYNTPINDRRFAYNLRASNWLRMLLLNFNYHRVHHHYPNVPWHQLPEVYAEKDNVARYSYGRQWLNQFKGLIHIQDIEKLNLK